MLALMSLSIIIVGVLTLAHVRELNKSAQKIRLTTLGVMFIFAGLTVEYNFLFLNGSNTSPVIVLGYAIAAVGFIVGLFFVRRKKT
jgi:membrane associated rhomboid family serine protease